jgi:hypothetical protein
MEINLNRIAVFKHPEEKLISNNIKKNLCPVIYILYDKKQRSRKTINNSKFKQKREMRNL